MKIDCASVHTWWNLAAGLPVTWSSVEEALQQVKGAISIVYPQGVPVYEPLRMELENREDLSGTQASKQVIDPAEGVLWFASKELQTGKIVVRYNFDIFFGRTIYD